MCERLSNNNRTKHQLLCNCKKEIKKRRKTYFKLFAMNQWIQWTQNVIIHYGLRSPVWKATVSIGNKVERERGREKKMWIFHCEIHFIFHVSHSKNVLPKKTKMVVQLLWNICTRSFVICLGVQSNESNLDFCSILTPEKEHFTVIMIITYRVLTVRGNRFWFAVD